MLLPTFKTPNEYGNGEDHISKYDLAAFQIENC